LTSNTTQSLTAPPSVLELPVDQPALTSITA
jgi:hypothetical protein